MPSPPPHLAECSLQNGIEATFGGVQVARHALAPHLPLEGLRIPGQGQHMVKAEGGLAALQPGGAGVAKFGGHRAHEGQHRFVHEGAKAWEGGIMRLCQKSLAGSRVEGPLLRTQKAEVHGKQWGAVRGTVTEE